MSKQVKHTPGPWWLEETAMGGNYCLVVHGPNKSNWETIAEVPGEYVKRNKKTGKDSHYVFPNAHLISAAPELLEALKRLVYASRDGDDSLAAAEDQADEAIAKAEGREP